LYFVVFVHLFVTLLEPGVFSFFVIEIKYFTMLCTDHVEAYKYVHGNYGCDLQLLAPTSLKRPPKGYLVPCKNYKCRTSFESITKTWKELYRGDRVPQYQIESGALRVGIMVYNTLSILTVTSIEVHELYPWLLCQSRVLGISLDHYCLLRV